MHGPTQLGIWLTSRCNLSCEFCVCKRDGVVNAPDVTPQLIERACDLFPSLRTAGIGGNGEPLLAPGLPDVLRVLRKRMQRVRMTTNGVLIARRDDIPWQVLNEVSVSVNEVNELRYSELCGAYKLDDVTRGVERLVGNKVPVNISFVLNRDRLEHVEEYFEFAKTYGVGVVQLFNTMPSAWDGDGVRQFWNDTLIVEDEIVERLRVLRGVARKLQLTVRWPLLIDRAIGPGKCQDPQMYLGLNGLGDTAICCRGLGPRAEAGNILTDGSSVWINKYAQSLRRDINEGRWPFKCTLCKYGYKDVQPKW
jgi:molybdenum cofactor biosynthesis enzyme MoaA